MKQAPPQRPKELLIVTIQSCNPSLPTQGTTCFNCSGSAQGCPTPALASLVEVQFDPPRVLLEVMRISLASCILFQTSFCSSFVLSYHLPYFAPISVAAFF